MITLIHPSRSRPQKSHATIQKWRERSKDWNSVELIVSIDEDDFHSADYEELYNGTICQYENRSAVDAINKAAAISSGDILIVVSDDTDCPEHEHWDKIILDATAGKSDFLLRVSDGIQKRICTMPIMDRVYYNRFGYIYNPIYRHSWADTELTEVAYGLGKIIVRNDIKFTHLHPEVTKEPKDALYLRNDKTHDEDRHIFEARKRINFGL